jgi:hypothetical protein
LLRATIYELNPEDCTVLSTLSHPEPGYNGAGLEMDEEGNLWTVSQNSKRVFLIDSGVPAYNDVPWLTINPTKGQLNPGQQQALVATINSQGLEPGVYLAAIYILSNSDREPRIRIPLSLIVTQYQQAVEAGGTAYTDVLGDPWAADRAYTAGKWGYVQKSSTAKTSKQIADTADQKLYQSQRINPYAYRFDNVPNGVYQVELGFAEISKMGIGKRLFDVIVENTTVLPAHDISYEVGTFRADSHTFFVEVTDKRMDLRLIERKGYAKPVINSLRISHRPDR